uniref:Uncharacterized protein TCIL3000_11_5610 n=1 Tax=Trypanosoma congolense (strain IL3000) TaxID=1068625 RepID=G0V0H6_TRYCI|nr:unnamed protein product [Trypanosoma congolense IL3000]
MVVSAAAPTRVPHGFQGTVAGSLRIPSTNGVRGATSTLRVKKDQDLSVKRGKGLMGSTGGDSETSERTYCDEYRSGWSKVMVGCTSGVAFFFVAAVFYALYALCNPYLGCISYGIAFSLVMHPGRRGGEGLLSRGLCLERMCDTYERWTSRSKLFGIIGSILSLRHFIRYALGRSVVFFGIDKLLGNWCLTTRKAVKILQSDVTPSKNKKPNKEEKTSNVFDAGEVHYAPKRVDSLFHCLLMTGLICFVAHYMFGLLIFFGMHAALFTLFIITVPFMSCHNFVTVMWRIWVGAFALFFLVGFSYNLALDVISVNEVVKQTTSVVVAVGTESADGKLKGNRSNIPTRKPGNEEMSGAFVELVDVVKSKLSTMLLKELAHSMNNTNATEFALSFQKALAPLMLTISSDWTLKSLVQNKQSISMQLMALKRDLALVDWVDVAKKIMERWNSCFVYVSRVALRFGSNVLDLFDTIYACMLLFVIARYMMQLEHTVLYYLLAKLLRVFDPQCGEYHAQNIEAEVTTSLLTLLQSFWHKACFRFCITFCLFKCWAFPTPLVFGVISAVIAILPLAPKFISPVAVAFIYKLWLAVYAGNFAAAALDPSFWSCFVAFCATYLDERLLCVSKGYVSDYSPNNSEFRRLRIPTTVVSISLVLGFFHYGFPGIFLGPMTIVLARVLYDNWDAAMR